MGNLLNNSSTDAAPFDKDDKLSGSRSQPEVVYIKGHLYDILAKCHTVTLCLTVTLFV